jgi:hypothetical protein
MGQWECEQHAKDALHAARAPALSSSPRLPAKRRRASSSLNCSRKRPLYLTVFQPSSALRAGLMRRLRKMLNALGLSNSIVAPFTCARMRGFCALEAQGYKTCHWCVPEPMAVASKRSRMHVQP